MTARCRVCMRTVSNDLARCACHDAICLQCLEQWIQFHPSRYCEICQQPYRNIDVLFSMSLQRYITARPDTIYLCRCYWLIVYYVVCWLCTWIFAPYLSSDHMQVVYYEVLYTIWSILFAVTTVSMFLNAAQYRVLTT